LLVFFFQAEDGIRDRNVTGVQTCALPICIVTDGHPGQHSNVGTDPHIIADNNSSRAHIRSSCGFNTVIQCSKHRIMPDEAIVPDFYTTLILEPTATINEYAVTKRNVFTEI